MGCDFVTASIGGGAPSSGHSAPDLVVVGSATRDVDPADPRGWRLGGAVAYGGLLAARLGARVGALIGADSEAASAHELRLLERAGVDVRLVPLEHGPVFDNQPTPRGRVQVAHDVADALPVSTWPAAWGSARAVLFGSVAGELGPDWAGVPGERSVVALAWQGLLRRMERGRQVTPLSAEPGPLLDRADLVGVSTEDLGAGGAPLDVLLRRNGQQLMLTASEAGGLHVRRQDGSLMMRRVPSIAARRLSDTTGAGDAFLTTWLLGSIRGGPFGPERLATGRAIALAAAVASLVVERRGLANLPDRAALARRLAELNRPRGEAG